MRRALLAGALAVAACGRTSIGPDSRVALEYELTSAGALIESSPKGEPLTMTMGTEAVPAAVEAALLGLRAGDATSVDLTVEKAFGPYDAKKLKDVPLAKFGDMAGKLKPGSTVDGLEGGKPSRGRVVKVEGGVATLDFNHPLAGKPLRYVLKIVAVER